MYALYLRRSSDLYASEIEVGCSVFGDAIGCVEATASNDTQEINYPGGCLMWSNADVFGGWVW